MEHIRQFDWCYSQPDVYFLRENDFKDSSTEKILRNKFRDPMISSDSEDETPKINWNEVFTKREQFTKNIKFFVPCLPKYVQYPKLSALTSYQHYQCLKVLCATSPHVLPEDFLARPTKSELKAFEELKPKYEKEQKEFIEWAKTQWMTVHCIRALRPKPPVEFVYDASFKMRETEMQCYPKLYDMAAQIPLETNDGKSIEFDMVLDGDIKTVDIMRLPQIECRPIARKLTILNQCSVPEPCNKHPCRFILPNESTVSVLPQTEVYRELAQFALDNNAPYIASENSLKCLLELDRHWSVTVTVVPVIGSDGETTNVVVLGNEFSVNRESSMTRTYKAFKHLLQHAVLPKSEKPKLRYKNTETSGSSNNENVSNDLNDSSSDDDEDWNLCIVDDLESKGSSPLKRNKEDNMEPNNKMDVSGENEISFYNCTCKDTIFETPPPRSFKRWRVCSNGTNERYAVIIHCSHKIKDKNGEVLLEPVPEYQLELGATQRSKEKLKSLTLSLLLRKNVTLVNAIIDGVSGEVALFEQLTHEEFKEKHGDLTNDVTNTLHTTLNQFTGLLPGTYILKHEPNHGSNAILYSSKLCMKPSITLQFDSTQLAEEDEAKNLKVAPVIAPILLPCHKYRKMLPCAFSPQERLVARPKPAPRRQRTPPRALEWPKKKKNRKKKKNT